MRLLNCVNMGDCYDRYGSSVYFAKQDQGQFFNDIYASKVIAWEKVIDEVRKGGLLPMGMEDRIQAVLRRHFPREYARELDLFMSCHGVRNDPWRDIELDV